MIHDNGGQVYLDGANMNAQVMLIEIISKEIDNKICEYSHHLFSSPEPKAHR